MMFNGLLMFTDSDSDFKDSVCRSSEFESPGSSCASARAQYYQNKLLATHQILQNKEETVRVQTESLAVAEARIAALTARTNDLKREVERKGREVKTLREALRQRKVEKTDVSVTANDVENQNIVSVLQNNLSVIEELYRECFYETAKQEGLIEMLRKSYLDVRLMEKEKSEQISRLHNVINTQKWSLDKFQDIASDVDNLKVEISNFLNNSNNDSGVWEESLAGGFTEDLQDIAGQLLRLRELLTGDCTCGLEEENRRLRQSNEEYEKQLNELNQNVAHLENTIKTKDETDKELQDLIEIKENELHSIRDQLRAAVAVEGQTCESMKQQLQQAHELLEKTSSKLVLREAQCKQHEKTVQTLKELVEHTNDISKEYCALRGSTCAAQSQLVALRKELAHALQNFALAKDQHRSEVSGLEAALLEAQARGGALCGEARRALRAVRQWGRRTAHVQRELEEEIKKKDSQITLLKQRLEREQNNLTLTRESERLEVENRCTQCDCGGKIFVCEDPSCDGQRKEPSCSDNQTSVSYKSLSQGRKRGKTLCEKSSREMSCSTPLPGCPAALQWLPHSFIKKLYCENRYCAPGSREACVQNPERCDVTTSSSDHEQPSCSSRRTDLGAASADGRRQGLPCEASASERSSSSQLPPSAGREQSFTSTYYCQNRICSPGTRDETAAACERGSRAGHARRIRGGAARHHKAEWWSMEDVLGRVESAGAALQDSLARWQRRAARS